MSNELIETLIDRAWTARDWDLLTYYERLRDRPMMEWPRIRALGLVIPRSDREQDRYRDPPYRCIVGVPPR